VRVGRRGGGGGEGRSVGGRRREGDLGDGGAVGAGMARAIALQPDDPSYRHLAGGLALRAGRPDEALTHFEVALTTERSTFRIGELHRWAALAADWSGQRASGRGHRVALTSDEPSFAGSRSALDKPLPRRRHREIGVDFQLLTLST